MSRRAVPAALEVAEQAISKEMRKAIAGSKLTHEEIRTELGVSQSWFSRRYRGEKAWESAAIQMVLNVVDEDITRVFAAGALAIEEWRKTNLCLSDSASVCSQRQGLWAQRGYELAKRIFQTDDQVAGIAA